MDKSEDKLDNKKCSFDESTSLKHHNCVHSSEVSLSRAFKRLKVDETVDNSSVDLDSSLLKSPTHSPRKSSLQDKRQSQNVFRRRIHTLSSNKEKIVPSLHSKDTKLEDDYEFGAKSKNICKDFSQMNLSGSERTQSWTKFSFSDNSKALSNWRNSCDGNKCKNDNKKENKVIVKEDKTCARQALYDNTSDASVDELAAYFDDNLYLPRKMSFMAEMMYT